MDLSSIFTPEVWKWVVLPVLIFCARIIDVSIGTVRIVFIAKGMRVWAPVLGFFEVLIWLLAISQIMKNLTNPVTFVAFATGFAMGNYVGLMIEHKLAMGLALIRVITNRDAAELLQHLREKEFSVTDVAAEGNRGPVKVIFSIIKRKEIPGMVNVIQQYNPHAFYTIEDISFVSEGRLPSLRERKKLLDFIGLKRK
ncbi:hypothetical protein AMJ86_04895 [bacterium SM23_57]|nr:MAG: hypothetical protein AMJ86_04895 [bacterium SM23_57]